MTSTRGQPFVGHFFNKGTLKVKNGLRTKELAQILALLVFVLNALPAQAQDNEALAKQLANPIAALISLPFQLNWDDNIGAADEGSKLTLNFQPVVPVSLNDKWNVISRTILPLISQDDIFPGAGDQFGLGDVVQSVFFSPKAPTASGWIWGIGPVFLLPTATDNLLGGEKWGGGPTGVALKQSGPWTYGTLFNHIWSFAGDSHRNDINASFVQPFLSYTTPKAWTFVINTESTYDWESEQWSIPANLGVSKVTKIGKQLVSVTGGLRYYLESTDSSAEGWGLRTSITLLFPR
jgi:hypothetical protein